MVKAVWPICVAKLCTKNVCGQAVWQGAKAEVRYRELHEGAVWEPFDRRPVSLKFPNVSSPTDSVSGGLRGWVCPTVMGCVSSLYAACV